MTIVNRIIHNILKDNYSRNKEVNKGDIYNRGQCPQCGAFGQEHHESNYGSGYIRCKNKKCQNYNNEIYYKDGKIE